MKDTNKFNEWYVVTGASRGLGLCFARTLLNKGYNLVAVARDTSSVLELASEYPHQKIINYNLDLSNLDKVYELYDRTKNLKLAGVINNAGFGVWGYFSETSLEKELNMIDLNIKALHILTKLYLQKFIKENCGRIINVGSVIAGMCPGPVFSAYYATKAYVWNISNAINIELKRNKSKVRVIAICPGVLRTDFWKRSSGTDSVFGNNKIKGIDVQTFANKSLDSALKAKHRNVITIGFSNKFVKWATIYLPKVFVWYFVYRYQKRK